MDEGAVVLKNILLPLTFPVFFVIATIAFLNYLNIPPSSYICSANLL
jgi:hypothetical protein